MAIWNNIKDEFERAGRAANSAIDEGKLRLTLIRARQTADRAAQKLGYAVFGAKVDGHDLSTDDYNRHASELATAKAEIARTETLLKEVAAGRGGKKPEASTSGAAQETKSDAPTAEPKSDSEP